MKTTTEEVQERKIFLQVYQEFYKFLSDLGFRTANTKESMSMDNYLYSHYDKDIDNLCGIEKYVNDALKLSLNFLTDRYEHKIMFVGDFGSSSGVYTIDKAKKFILDEVRKIRDQKLEELKPYLNI